MCVLVQVWTCLTWWIHNCLLCTNGQCVPSTFLFWKFTASYSAFFSFWLVLLLNMYLEFVTIFWHVSFWYGADARREARKAFLAFSSDENTKETSDSLVLETEVETSLDPQFSEDITFSETTLVSQLSCFSLQTRFMLLIVIATGFIHLLFIIFLNFSI